MHGLKPPSFFAHKEKAWGGGWCGLRKESLLESLLDVILHCLALRDGQRVNSTLGEFSFRQQVDGTVPWPVRWKASGCLLAEHILERLVVRWDKFTWGSGLLTRVEHTWTYEDLLSGLGIEDRQFWKQVLFQRVNSQGYRLTSGECRLSQGRPRMISTVGPSSTRNEMVSSHRRLTCSFRGGSSIINPSMPKRFSFNGLDSELPGLPLTG